MTLHFSVFIFGATNRQNRKPENRRDARQDMHLFALWYDVLSATLTGHDTLDLHRSRTRFLIRPTWYRLTFGQLKLDLQMHFSFAFVIRYPLFATIFIHLRHAGTASTVTCVLCHFFLVAVNCFSHFIRIFRSKRRTNFRTKVENCSRRTLAVNQPVDRCLCLYTVCRTFAFKTALNIQHKTSISTLATALRPLLVHPFPSPSRSLLAASKFTGFTCRKKREASTKIDLPIPATECERLWKKRQTLCCNFRTKTQFFTKAKRKKANSNRNSFVNILID